MTAQQLVKTATFHAFDNFTPQIQLRSLNGNVNEISTVDDGDFVIYMNGVVTDEKFRIVDNTGFVGINNGNPQRQLDVAGSANVSSFIFSNRLRISGNADGNAWATGVNGDGIYREGKIYITDKQTPADATDKGLNLLNYAETNRWTLLAHNSANDLDFWQNGVLKSYINDVDGSYVVVSDIARKKNITPLHSVLADVMKLETLKYHYKENEDSSTKTIGMIAQEVHKSFPELATNDGDRTGINYAGFSVVALKAIQEQQAIIEELQSELSEIKELLKEK